MDQRLQFGIKQGIAGRDPIDADREFEFMFRQHAVHDRCRGLNAQQADAVGPDVHVTAVADDLPPWQRCWNRYCP